MVLAGFNKEVASGYLDLNLILFLYFALILLAYVLSFLFAQKYIVNYKGLIIIVFSIIHLSISVPITVYNEGSWTVFKYWGSDHYNRISITIFNRKIWPIDHSWTALIEASRNGDTDIVKNLIESTPAHKVEVDINKQDTDGKTALHWASYYRHIDIVKILIGTGANLDIKDLDGNTALIVASGDDEGENGDINIVKALIEAKADMNIKSEKGFPALIIAALYGNTEIVKALIEVKADVNAITEDGYTALMIASLFEREKETELMKLLKKAGATNGEK